jgi:hypothetical protein
VHIWPKALKSSSPATPHPGELKVGLKLAI